jgi:hypothetical protein
MLLSLPPGSKSTNERVVNSDSRGSAHGKMDQATPVSKIELSSVASIDGSHSPKQSTATIDRAERIEEGK